MTDKQPEALRLADLLDYAVGIEGYVRDEAAAELRRLHEVETKYHESIGGFKRDLAEKLEQQRKKNERLTDELRRLHEVNAELVEALRPIAKQGEISAKIITNVSAAIFKATGE